jgi:hypothetical protein
MAAFNVSCNGNLDRSKAIYSYVKNPHTGKAGYLTHEEVTTPTAKLRCSGGFSNSQMRVADS